MLNKSKLVKMEIYNLGCIGPEGLVVDLDEMLCLVGPNNTGKSTVLRAYELAVGNKNMTSDDICKRSADNENPRVILYVHIPPGTPNIDERWKFQENGYHLVKTKWEWDSSGNKLSRQTYDPEIEDFSETSKASGLDTVFSSRLPIPFRIGALEEPKEEHNKLLQLILQPISDRLRVEMDNENSDLSKAISKISSIAKKPVEEERENLEKFKNSLNISHNQIFPNLKIDFSINMGSIKIDPIKLLQENSSLKFSEWNSEVNWDRQGTGSQRALFWTMMQVRSELKSVDDVKKSNEKEISDKRKSIKKLEKDIKNIKGDEKRNQKLNEIEKLKEEIDDIQNRDSEELLKTQRDMLQLPGYMLLIDEPEVALHPNAIRAASSYLYNLSRDKSWQVMLTTHSPAFINPLEDHTTIIRLDRTEENPTPKIYRSDSIQFSNGEKENLKLLNRFDLSLSEMFFGQYPIIVEGDTEYAAFEYLMNSDPEVYKVSNRPIMIRAHGKYTIVSIIKILSHFKVNFSVLHDSDFPYRSDGKGNSAWKANESIFEEIEKARKSGLNVIHRISIPYFELEHSEPEISHDGSIIDSDPKDKPWNMISKLKDNDKLKTSINSILANLSNPKSEPNPFGDDIDKALRVKLEDWANQKRIKDRRIFKNV